MLKNITDKTAHNTQHIVNKAWSFAHVLRDDGLSYTAYTEQITLLLFLKMADELTRPPHNRPCLVPEELNWPSLIELSGAKLETHYRRVLEELGKQSGMLGTIFNKARPDIQDPAKLRRLIVDLIDKETWTGLQADVKGDIYEGLLARGAAESPSGAGQYFTPRELIKAIVDVMRPRRDERIADPAAGTGGFLTIAHDYAMKNQGAKISAKEKQHLRENFARAWELVPNTARLCLMNLYLHGMDGGPQSRSLVTSGEDSLQHDPGERFSMILANPPFGKKSSFTVISEDGDLERDDIDYHRGDFWATTKNKQLNFLQHIHTLLEVDGRAAVVLPDNVLFEGGAGETVRRKLLQCCDVHTLLRLPTGIFYKPGVKANVLFFDKKPTRNETWTEKLWIYDARTNHHYTLKQNPLRRADLDEFVHLFHATNRHKRKATWSSSNPEGRWRAYPLNEILNSESVNLDLFWIKDKSLEDLSNLPAPDVIALEIADDLQALIEIFSTLAVDLKSTTKI